MQSPSSVYCASFKLRLFNQTEHWSSISGASRCASLTQSCFSLAECWSSVSDTKYCVSLKLRHFRLAKCWSSVSVSRRWLNLNLHCVSCALLKDCTMYYQPCTLYCQLTQCITRQTDIYILYIENTKSRLDDTIIGLASLPNACCSATKFWLD